MEKFEVAAKLNKDPKAPDLTIIEKLDAALEKAAKGSTESDYLMTMKENELAKTQDKIKGREKGIEVLKNLITEIREAEKEGPGSTKTDFLKTMFRNEVQKLRDKGISVFSTSKKAREEAEGSTAETPESAVTAPETAATGALGDKKEEVEIEAPEQEELVEEGTTKAPELESLVTDEAAIEQIEQNKPKHQAEAEPELEQAIESAKEEKITPGNAEGEKEKKVFMDLLYTEDIKKIDKFDISTLPEDFRESSEVKEAVEKAILLGLTKAQIRESVSVANKLWTTQEDLFVSSAGKVSARKGIEYGIQNSKEDAKIIGDVFEMAGMCEIGDEVVYDAVNEAIVSAVFRNRSEDILNLIRSPRIPEDIKKQAARDSLVKMLEASHVDSFIEYAERFEVPDEFLKSDQIQDLIRTLPAKDEKEISDWMIVRSVIK